MELKLSYEAAREYIQDGDCISFKPRGINLIHWITTWVTKKKYYHTGMAVWLSAKGGSSRLFVCEAHRTGRRLMPLSIYEKFEFDVIACPIDFLKIEGSLLEKVGKVKYGFLDFINAGVRILFGKPAKDCSGEICSEMVQDKYEEAGFKMPSYVMEPGELSEYLLANGAVPRVSVVR